VTEGGALNPTPGFKLIAGKAENKQLVKRILDYLKIIRNYTSGRSCGHQFGILIAESVKGISIVLE
jgi:hypothetical protein